MLSEPSIERGFYGQLHQLYRYGIEVCLSIDSLVKLACQGYQYLLLSSEMSIG